jgi:hypothetical protein
MSANAERRDSSQPVEERQSLTGVRHQRGVRHVFIFLVVATKNPSAAERAQPDGQVEHPPKLALGRCLFGGLIGLVFGYGIGALAASFIPGFPPAYTPWWAVALALGFSGVVGVVFGILPAAKAANLDPISSLRYE